MDRETCGETLLELDFGSLLMLSLFIPSPDLYLFDFESLPKKDYESLQATMLQRAKKRPRLSMARAESGYSISLTDV